MNVTRNVIVDLLPLYVAGEVSEDTRALVDEYLKGDSELALSAGAGTLENLADARPVAGPSEDGEMKALRRTRHLLAWQRRLCAWALAASILSMSGVFFIQNGHAHFHPLLGDYPTAWGGCVSLM